MPKRRSLWPLTWLPRPRTKRPFELACRSQAWLAITVGLRGKATAIDGVSSMRSVASAAKASGVKTSCPSSTVISASKPAASAATPNGPASRQCLMGSIVKTRIPVHSTLRRGNRIIAAEGSRAKKEVWMTSRNYQIFELGDVGLQSGLTLRNAQLAYKTYGRLDPERYFIIIPNMFGNGLSSSPSNVGPPHDRGRFPGVTVADNVRMQHRLLREQLGVERVGLVHGWSMGGQQAYHWAALYPEMVERIGVVCGSARTAPHNQVFLEGIKYALMADPAWHDGYFAEPPLRGLRAMGRIYAGWALSQAFYREEL